MAIEESRREPLMARLREVAGVEFRGLTIGESGVDFNRDDYVEQDGRFAVRWTVTGVHGDRVATEEEPGPQFLGWYATGQRVQVPVVSRGDVLRDGFFIRETIWNHLLALAQIGVQAVGRPVVVLRG